MKEQGARLLRSINREIGNPLEWTSCAKAMLLGASTFLMFMHYGLFAEYQLSVEPPSKWLDLDHLAEQLPYYYGFAVASLLMFVVMPLIHRVWGDHVIFEYVATIYFSISLSYFSYQVGTLSLPVGAVMLGAPIVGFIFFNRRAVVVSLACAIVLQLLLSLGAGLQWWSYAPIYSDAFFTESRTSLFMVSQMYVFTLPQMLFLIAISYLVLRRWRDREEQVRHLSITDPLTGLFNRRSILTHLEHEQDRSRKKGPVLSILMVDLDNFKEINDKLGHEAGDVALIAAADALQSCLRQNDRVGRYGGEEFLIILPGTTAEGARLLAERCRQVLERQEVVLNDGKRFNLTGSFGLVCNDGNIHMHVDELLRRADQAMYTAKRRGRNQVVMVGENQ